MNEFFTTVLFTDIENSSLYWEQCPKQMSRLLDVYETRMRKLIEIFNGFLVKTVGDSFMVLFENFEMACLFSIKVQTETNIDFPLKFRNGQCLCTRIGFATGNVEMKKNEIQNNILIDVYGKTVNTANRLEEYISPNNGFSFALLNNSELKNANLKFLQEIIGNRFTIEYEVVSHLKGIPKLGVWTVSLSKRVQMTR